LVPIVSQTFGTFQSLRHFFRKFSKTAEKRLFSCPFAQSEKGGTHRTAKEAGSPIGPPGASRDRTAQTFKTMRFECARLQTKDTLPGFLS
jgi:hypothetical protein